MVGDAGRGVVRHEPVVSPPEAGAAIAGVGSARSAYPADAPQWIIELVCAERFRWDCGVALKIIYCESTYSPDAINASGHRGLWQISPIHAPKWPDYYTAWADPVRNTEWAYELWLRQGFRPWSCW